MSGTAIVIRDTNEKFCRDYFEFGCLCIQNGTLEKLGASVDDRIAADFYESNCSCSRNYCREIETARANEQPMGNGFSYY